MNFNEEDIRTIVGYSLVFSSADFSEIYEEIVPSDKIFDVLSSGYTYDFNIVSGVLMCEDVPRITASETDYNLFSIKRRINFDDDTIYSFILEGMLNDYLIVDDSVDGFLKDCTEVAAIAEYLEKQADIGAVKTRDTSFKNQGIDSSEVVM